MMTLKQKAKLLEIFNILDVEIGDTDPIGMTQAEIKEEEPLFWCAKEIAKLLGKNWDRYASILNQIEIPTPAELAQQLADLVGIRITCYQDVFGIFWLTDGDAFYDDGSDCNAVEGWWNFHGCKWHIKVSRSVNYTGSWQDSKVTTEPNHIGNVNEKVALKQMAERNK